MFTLSLKPVNLEISLCHLAEYVKEFSLSACSKLQHDYFSSFNQSNHCFLASSLPLPSSMVKLSNNVGWQRETSSVYTSLLRIFLFNRVAFGRAKTPCNANVLASKHVYKVNPQFRLPSWDSWFRKKWSMERGWNIAPTEEGVVSSRHRCFQFSVIKH